MDKTQDKNKLFVEMSYDGSLIDYGDDEFNQKYWFQFTKFQSESENEARRFQEILNKDLQEFIKLYEKSKENLSKSLDKLRNDETINEFKIEALKDTKKAIGRTEEFITLMEGFQNASNENLRKFAKELLLFCKNAKGVLEQHYKFFLSPDEFLESETCMNNFAEYTAGVNEHSENIEEFLKQLK